VKSVAIFFIRVYQRCISPLIPPRCRFEPTCSAYAIEAIRTKGLIRGTLKAAWRILRCNPWSRGGYDPVDPPPVDNSGDTSQIEP
jgi:putative membrane protein insertion efficiency factor